MKNKIIILITLLLFPFNTYAYSNYIIPGGNNIGIEVNNKGIIVIGFYKINDKYNTSDLKVGDIITKINNNKVNTINEMVNEISNNVKDNKVLITIERDNKEQNIEFNLIKVDNTYKTGLYVKDSITGIGTLTYIDPTTNIYGALGHEIIESNSLVSVEVRSGSIFESNVTSIDKSYSNRAGTKNAELNKSNNYGTIETNNISGIFGKYTSTIDENNTMEVGSIEDLKLGKASIYTVIENNEVKEYEIEITKINKNSNIKNISFTVTDKELLDKTGGIVQGMSGSPIIQDNKIYGAVTHVIVNNPKTGYGINIKTMLESGDKIN